MTLLKSLAQLAAALAVAGNLLTASAFDLSRTDNIVEYYGQNSYGATSTDTSLWQQNLAFYCQDDTISTFPLAFLTVFFGTDNLPEINLANTCNSVDNSVFSGTSLANCQFMASDIQTCQAAGKIITLSLGGATGAATFSSDSQAEEFAQTIWDLFLGGSSTTRPFGDAVLDGIDLDIEGGGSTGFVAFVNKIRSLASGADKQYYITAAPQCVFPDANLGSVLNSVGFDAIYVQFYNNWCGLQNYGNANAWNFGTWDDWAKNTSPNPNVKVYIGAPASSTAAGSGYVDAATLANIVTQTRNQYSSFGGVMFWDASQAYANGRIDTAVKSALTGGSTTTSTSTTTTKTTTTTSKTTTTTSTTTPPTTSTTTTTSATTTTTSSGGSTSCNGVAAWSSTTTYVGGNQVTYNGQLWTASWWSYNDTPGGAAGVWVSHGSCASLKVASTATTATPAATLTDSRHVVDKARTINTVVPETGTPASVEATAAPTGNPRMKRVHFSSGF
ncbi:glycoside hydrolase family 18 protein [Desarmillaria tabescens]|uniref:chitinase n=1 Tax=Armillaria tabescens TaxID=1929756 RepID=A0AA39NQH7_ARMTA|nr:glycoside hydrolase family 18 protein [Desarmillaria tabescens]KAK0469953.1 glycoside hydrolase family 18 protein [Desarmillaria tabescens]